MNEYILASIIAVAVLVIVVFTFGIYDELKRRREEKMQKICTNCKYIADCENVMYYAYTKKQCNDFKPKSIQFNEDTCVSCGGYADDGHLCWKCRQESKG